MTAVESIFGPRLVVEDICTMRSPEPHEILDGTYTEKVSQAIQASMFNCMMQLVSNMQKTQANRQVKCCSARSWSHFAHELADKTKEPRHGIVRLATSWQEDVGRVMFDVDRLHKAIKTASNTLLTEFSAKSEALLQERSDLVAFGQLSLRVQGDQLLVSVYINFA